MVVADEALQNNEQVISTEHLSAGLYTLQVWDMQGNILQKLYIKKSD